MKRTPKTPIILTATILSILSPVCLQADVIHPLEGLDPQTDGMNVESASPDWFRGWEFKVKADNLLVTELGLRMPVAGENVVIELWDDATQSLLASTSSIFTQQNAWQYEILSSSVMLTNGGLYTVGVFAESDASFWWQDFPEPSPYKPTGDIEYQTMRFHNESTSQFPTLTFDVSQYGIPDIGYQVVPEPSTLLLALITLGIINGWRK